MTSIPKKMENHLIKTKEEIILLPHIDLLNKCKDLSILIKEQFLNRNQSSNNHPEILPEYKNFNINNDIIYKDLLSNSLFLNDLNKLITTLYSIIGYLESYSKKLINIEKMSILFNLNNQLNKYLNNIPKDKVQKRNFLISSNSDFLNDNYIIGQINKFISLNEKEDQESKETVIIHKDNNFDNLSEIMEEKDSAKISIFEEEKELIEHFKDEDKEKEKEIFKKEEELTINDDISLLNHKLKKNENLIEMNENN